MFARPSFTCDWPADVRSLRMMRARAYWKPVLALITALALLSMMYTAAVHRHDSLVGEYSCSICHVVVHKMAGGSAPKMPERIERWLPWLAYTDVSLRLVPLSSCVIPPSCGPPLV